MDIILKSFEGFENKVNALLSKYNSIKSNGMYSTEHKAEIKAEAEKQIKQLKEECFKKAFAEIEKQRAVFKEKPSQVIDIPNLSNIDISKTDMAALNIKIQEASLKLQERMIKGIEKNNKLIYLQGTIKNMSLEDLKAAYDVEEELEALNLIETEIRARAKSNPEDNTKIARMLYDMGQSKINPLEKELQEVETNLRYIHKQSGIWLDLEKGIGGNKLLSLNAI